MILIKAFDKVPRQLLFEKLYKLGIRGKIFRVIRNIYSKNKAKVLFGSYLSPEFDIRSGVMPGSKLGPLLFLIFVNDLLNTLHESELGAKLDKLTISTLGFADDIVLISDSPEKLQRLIDMCLGWAQQNHMEFNSSKCKVMVLNRSCTGLEFTLYGKKLDIVKSYKYLGVTLCTRRLTSLYSEHFSKTIEKAEKRLQCIKHYGFHRDGLEPKTAIKMYKLLVRPILEYAAQVLFYQHYYLHSNSERTLNLDEPTDFVKTIEHFQTQTLKYPLGSPKSSSPAVVRLFSGVEPISSRIDLLQLRYFWKLSHSDETNIAFRVFDIRKKRFFGSKHGFLHNILNLCCKYDIINVWNGNLGFNLRPKMFIKKIVHAYNFKKDFNSCRKKSCCFVDVYLKNTFFDEESYDLIKPFKAFNFFCSVSARSLIIKVLLHSRQYMVDCHLCDGNFRYIFDHYVYDCNNLATLRQQLRNRLIFYNFPINCILDKNKFLECCLGKRIWTKCLTDFLDDAAF